MRRPWSPSAECGTYAGWNVHKGAGTPPCEPCRAAAADYMAAVRFRRGDQRNPRRCKDCGSVFAAHACSMGGAA